MRGLLRGILYPKNYIWIDVFLIHETRRAILIKFDGKKAWFPKAWILKIRPSKDSKAVKIKISESHWAMKFS
ncbi:MAG: hypothetical protein L6416_03865 [Candidatus Omnitrophica bacterium]|nr:hypothetical protein [Candidatus Omnitrophota bacterium]